MNINNRSQSILGMILYAMERVCNSRFAHIFNGQLGTGSAPEQLLAEVWEVMDVLDIQAYEMPTAIVGVCPRQQLQSF